MLLGPQPTTVRGGSANCWCPGPTPAWHAQASHTHVSALVHVGARVALAELPMGFLAGPDKGGVGGTCVLRGCVPKKLMLYAAEFATEATASQGFG